MTAPTPRSLPWPYEQRDGWLFCQGVRLVDIAKEFGTPCYVYSEAAILKAYETLACPDSKARMARICYAVKANSNLAILRLLAKAGAGFDIVSGGELQRVLAAGGAAHRVVFSGVGKSKQELRLALEQAVGCINVESLAELQQLETVAEDLGLTAPISIRVNPDIDAKTHPYISTGLKENKFGLGLNDALEAYKRAQKSRHLRIVGVDCHIGSQITSLQPFQDATKRLLAFVTELHHLGISLAHIDLGGGLGICYKDEQPPSAEELKNQGLQMVADWAATTGCQSPEVVFEMGRSIVGASGLLLSQVLLLKSSGDPTAKNFAIVDAAMNDLMRPSLYQAWHDLVLLHPRQSVARAQTWDVVGPVCETGDWLARERSLELSEGDLLAFASAGAYGSTMGSNYNSRARPPEVLIRSDGSVNLIRRRETFQELIELEKIPQDLWS
ncbi:MAG: diaminopimelate decarboxylase [Pseudomonadota bacterium]